MGNFAGGNYRSIAKDAAARGTYDLDLEEQNEREKKAEAAKQSNAYKLRKFELSAAHAQKKEESKWAYTQKKKEHEWALALQEQKNLLEAKKEIAKIAAATKFGQGKPEARTEPTIEEEESGMSLASPFDLGQEPEGLGDQFDPKEPFIKNPSYIKTGEGKPFIANPAYIKPQAGAGISGLSGEEEVKARALARKLYGVRGAERGLPAVTKLMNEGKSIDEIEDLIRFSGQSKEFTGNIRSAAQEVLINVSPTIAERSMDFIDDELSKGNITGVKSKLKRIARKTAGTEMSRQLMGKERTVEFLGEIQDDLNKLESSGVDTNIFTGTIEDVNSKLGRVNNPELRKTATRIKVGIMNYRRAMSGAAFSVPESAEYSAVFPSIGKTAEFNTANLDALRETFKGDLDNFYGLAMGPENYRELYPGEVSQPKQQGLGFNKSLGQSKQPKLEIYKVTPVRR